MSWLEARSQKEFNRIGYIVYIDAKKSFHFRYSMQSAISEPDIVEGMEVQKKTEIIETPAQVHFDLDSVIEIKGILYNVENVIELEPKDANGQFRGKAVIITQLTISRRL